MLFMLWAFAGSGHRQAPGTNDVLRVAQTSPFDVCDSGGSADPRSWGPRVFFRKSRPDASGRYACLQAELYPGRVATVKSRVDLTVGFSNGKAHGWECATRQIVVAASCARRITSALIERRYSRSHTPIHRDLCRCS